jgi:RNA polymerase sigma-70 factor (ECF subfamily)
VLAASTDTPGGRDALAELCQAYWYPLYAYVRRQGYGAEEARDLTQAYFLRLLEKGYLKEVAPEKGRFRSFLLASLRHFLANERDRATALKRGGVRLPVSLESDEPERRYRVEPLDESTPETVFERRWALTVLERALGHLRGEMSAAGRADQFDRLKDFLTWSEPAAPYGQVAAQLGMSEGALKVAVHRLRRRCGALLREEIAQTVAAPEQVEEEVRHLIAALGG